MAVFRRVLFDGADLGLLVLTVLFMYGLFYAFGSVLSDLYSAYLLGVISSPDPLVSLRSLFYDSISTLSEPLTLLSMFVYGILLLYLSLVVVGWIGKRRISCPENPFKRAVDVLIPAAILSIILLAPLSLLFSIILLLSSNTTVLIVALSLFFLVSLVYSTVVSPSIASLVIDSDSVSQALRNGVLVGRRRWFSILLHMFGVSLVTTVLLYLFGIAALALPWTSDFLLVLYQAVAFILPLAVITEVYVSDAHGV